MKIEKLNDDKIRVTFSVDDLKEKNIDFHSFMSNSIESQKLFLDMLDVAKNEFDFITDDYKILIETTAVDNSNFICNLTRVVPDFDKEKFTTHNVHIKKRKSLKNSGITIYAFNCFEDFISFCNFFVEHFDGDISVFSKDSMLFLYDSTYFLLLNNVSANLNLLESFCACISEFAYFVSNSSYFENKLFEFGKLIIENDAIFSTFKCFAKS